MKTLGIYKIAAVVALVIAGIAVIRIQVRPRAVSSAEFFERNPHLKKPMNLVQAPADVLRTDIDFKIGDFQLPKGKLYKIKFLQSTSFWAQGKALGDVSTRGEVWLHSHGIQNGRLVLLAEFFLKEFPKTFLAPPEKAPKNFVNEGLLTLGVLPPGFKIPAGQENKVIAMRSLMLKFDPRGILREVLADTGSPHSDAVAMKINLVDTLFRKIETLSPGTHRVTEGDSRGRPYDVIYLVTDESDRLQVKVTSTLSDHLVGSKEKAAASGAPALALLDLETRQEQEMRWEWSKSEQRPLKQSAEATSQLIASKEKLVSLGLKAQTVWGDVQSDSPMDAVNALLKFPLDFNAIRSRSSAKNSLRLASQNGSKGMVTFNDLMKQFSKLDDGKLSESDIEKLFIDTATALKYDSTLLGQVRQRALMSGIGSRESTVMMGALGYEGSPEAQKALIEMYNRPDATKDEKLKVLTEFVVATQPLTADTKNFLKKEFSAADPMQSEFASTAGLALGGSISLDGDPQTIQLIRGKWDQTSAGLFSAAPPHQISQQSYLLAVMGNSKGDAFLPEVKAASTSTSSEVRSEAADAVRFAQDPSSQSLLFDTFLKDSDPKVRMAAADALRYQPFNERTKQALFGCSAGDSNLGVKIICYRVLGYRIEFSGVRDYLTGRLNSESDLQVKGVIQGSLSIQK